MNIQNQIIKAIQSKIKIEFNYKGEGKRIVCPHALYLSNKENGLLDAYQLSGFSNQPEKIPDWRQFDIKKITELLILDDYFNLAPGYKSSSRRYDRAIEII